MWIRPGVRLDAEAGDAVLLRALRGPGERRIRPFHFVGRGAQKRVDCRIFGVLLSFLANFDNNSHRKGR